MICTCRELVNISEPDAHDTKSFHLPKISAFYNHDQQYSVPNKFVVYYLDEARLPLNSIPLISTFCRHICFNWRK